MHYMIVIFKTPVLLNNDRKMYEIYLNVVGLIPQFKAVDISGLNLPNTLSINVALCTILLKEMIACKIQI